MRKIGHRSGIFWQLVNIQLEKAKVLPGLFWEISWCYEIPYSLEILFTRCFVQYLGVMQSKSDFDQAKFELAQELRNLRREAKRSGRELAEAIYASPPKLSRIERGHVVPSEHDVAKIADSLGVSAQKREMLVLQARSLADELRSPKTGPVEIGKPSRWLNEKEETMLSFVCLTHSAIPGLLQTPDYARAVLSCGFSAISSDTTPSPNPLERAISSRIERQGGLYDRGRSFSFILFEAALRNIIGSRAIMAKQCRDLLERLTLPNVSIGFITSDTLLPCAVFNNFIIHDNDRVVLESAYLAVTLTDPEELRRFQRQFEAFTGVAKFGHEAAAAIEAIAREYEEADLPDIKSGIPDHIDSRQVYRGNKSTRPSPEVVV